MSRRQKPKPLTYKQFFDQDVRESLCYLRKEAEEFRSGGGLSEDLIRIAYITGVIRGEKLKQRYNEYLDEQKILEEARKK